MDAEEAEEAPRLVTHTDGDTICLHPGRLPFYKTYRKWMSAEREQPGQYSVGMDILEETPQRLTLVLGHTLHTIVGREVGIGLAVNPVSSLILVPHVSSEDAVTDGLADVSTQHGHGGRLVLGRLVLVHETGTGGVTGAVADEDHGRGHGTLRVGSNIGGDHDETEGETDRLTVDQPETDESGPGVSLFVREEDHETGSQDTDQVTDGDHDDPRVLELGGDDTGDQERDDLERSTGTVEQRGVESAETQSLDDGPGKVGEDTVGDRGSEHGERQHPSLDVGQGRETLLDVEGGGLDTGTVLGHSGDGERSEFRLEPFGVGRTVRQEKVEDSTPRNGDGSQDVEDELPTLSRLVAQSEKRRSEGEISMQDSRIPTVMRFRRRTPEYRRP